MVQSSGIEDMAILDRDRMTNNVFLTTSPTLSIIIPTLNERDNIEPLVALLTSALARDCVGSNFSRRRLAGRHSRPRAGPGTRQSADPVSPADRPSWLGYCLYRGRACVGFALCGGGTQPSFSLMSRLSELRPRTPKRPGMCFLPIRLPDEVDEFVNFDHLLRPDINRAGEI
jgi:hypothetical protein